MIDYLKGLSNRLDNPDPACPGWARDANALLIVAKLIQDLENLMNTYGPK